MTAAERRSAILAAVAQSPQPVSATALARRFGVSRQSRNNRHTWLMEPTLVMRRETA